MKNFLKVAEGVNVTPLLVALANNPDLWNQNTLRTKHPGTAHAEVSDILVFFNEITDDPSAVIDDKAVIPYPAWDRLPQLRPIIFDLMHLVGGVQLGRVIITRLPPGKTITPHVDGGAPAEWYVRYQLALESLPGALFHCGDETVQFRPGDIWGIDNTQEHSVVNNSTDSRTVCIIDVRSA